MLKLDFKAYLMKFLTGIVMYSLYKKYQLINKFPNNKKYMFERFIDFLENGIYLNDVFLNLAFTSSLLMYLKILRQI